MKAPNMAASAAILGLGLAGAGPAGAAPFFFFSTGSPDHLMASASRPDVGAFEIESADDFILPAATSLTNATFTGLIPAGSTVKDVVVEIYRVFPKNSAVGRTSGPPDFSTPQVPTRVNSPSDVAFRSRDSLGGELTFTTSVLSSSFTALNSVQPGGIHLATGGDGAVTGEEVQFSVDFSKLITLPADHYFFVPQVELNDDNNFLWLSAPKPTTPPFTPDLQSWTRDKFLEPDWMRIATDIVGAPPAFNAAFSVTGAVPADEPAGLALLSAGLLSLAILRRRMG